MNDVYNAASPYLLSLGLTKSHMAMVFLAGPLSGLIVQPLVGGYTPTNLVHLHAQRHVSLTHPCQDFWPTTQNRVSEDGDRT